MNKTKENIIKKSLMLFLRKSYRDVTMRDIVEATGLSKGAFYHYFRSKEDLFREITSMFFTMGHTDYKTFDHNSLYIFYNQYLDIKDKSFRKIEELFRESGEENASYNFFFILFEAVSRFPDFLELELSMYKDEVRIWKNVIKNARSLKEISSLSDDRQIADLFLSSTDGVFIRFLNNDRKSTYVNDLKNIFDTIYENIKNPVTL